MPVRSLALTVLSGACAAHGRQVCQQHCKLVIRLRGRRGLTLLVKLPGGQAAVPFGHSGLFGHLVPVLAGRVHVPLRQLLACGHGQTVVLRVSPGSTDGHMKKSHARGQRRQAVASVRPLGPCRRLGASRCAESSRHYAGLRQWDTAHCPAWTGSWTGAKDNPGAASAVSAVIRVICAASAHGAGPYFL
jgi:hypothetical protein